MVLTLMIGDTLVPANAISRRYTGLMVGRPFLRLAFLAMFLIGMVSACSASNDTPDNAVHILTANGTVGPVMARYIDRGDGESVGGK